MTDDMIDAVSKALCRAWQLGQTYWKQADSDSYKQQDKSDETKKRFEALIDETRQLLASQPAQSGEPIYQVQKINGTWEDVQPFEKAGKHGRIVYTAPQSQLAQSAVQDDRAHISDHDAKGLEVIAGWLDKDRLTESAAMVRRLAARAASPQATATQPAQTRALRGLSQRFIDALESECDGLAITDEQASNILAYLQYGAPMDDVQRDAERYRKLRSADINAVHKGGVFAGLTPDNVVINGEDLDIAVDLLIDDAARPATGGDRD